MITPIRRGETIELMNVVYDRLDPVMVLSPCAHVGVGYFCSEHFHHCGNVADLVEHLQIDEPHRVAVYCPNCACYREADAAQLTALDPHPTSNP